MRPDSMLDAAARRLLAWSWDHAEPDRRPWIEGMRSELEVVEGGRARLLWALGVLPVVTGLGAGCGALGGLGGWLRNHPAATV